ncbi:MAG: hypothetical protein KDD64_16335, partial [Bdellovibrionales bacterium]|nr:hypothetical protein [Bdellovibrionales bacterium]
MAVFIPQQLKARCLEFLIFPLARYCVRHALTLQDFLAVTKICFVKAAEEEIRKSGEKLNTSRICIITGMYRNEVNKILKSETVLAEQPLGPGARVLTQWSKNPDFLTKGGKPRVLSFKGENNEFQQLVHSVSRHLTPGTVLFELERMQLVERTPRGLRMKESIDYVGDNPEKGFELLSNDINSLISAVEENVFDRQKVSNV